MLLSDPTGTEIVVVKTPPGINVTCASELVIPPTPISGVNVVVAAPKLVNVMKPLITVLALALEGKLMTVLMSDSKGVKAADEKLLLVLISGTLLAPTLPVRMLLLVPTSNTVVVENTPPGTSVT